MPDREMSDRQMSERPSCDDPQAPMDPTHPSATPSEAAFGIGSLTNAELEY